jgi:hypothetical protein
MFLYEYLYNPLSNIVNEGSQEFVDFQAEIFVK